MPFGESLVSQNRSNYYNNGFKFNAKELDENTGYYYYGARYYDPQSSIWLSVDPLAEKFPNYGGYVYTFNNPVNMTDPTGMAPEDLDNEYKIYKRGGQVQKVEYVSNKGGDKLDFITEVDMDYPAPYANSSKSYVIGVEKFESKVNTNLSSKHGEVAWSERGIGYRHDYMFEAQSQAIEPMYFDSPFFVVGGVAKVFKENRKIKVYRVFGGDSRAQGFSWTSIDPTNVKDFRNLAGLPSGGASGSINSANFMIEGQVKAKYIIKSRPALPLDGNVGGLPELIINPKNVKLNNFKIINP